MRRILLPLAAALSVSPAHAQDTPTERLPEVVVTATRLSDIDAPVPNNTVITRADIEARQSLTLADVLQQEAGVVITGNGGPLTNTSVFLRGSASNQVLILVDGVRVNDANQGVFDLSLLRADDIERIEIARGPYSSQYGSDAIGGVIQVFTRKSAPAEAGLRAGSFNTWEFNAGASTGDSRNGASVRIGHLDTDGFSATAPNNPFGYTPDNDGGQLKTAQLSGQAELGDRLDARFSGSWKEGRTEFDDGVNDQEMGVASASLAHQLTDNWEQTLQAGFLYNNLATDGRSSSFGYYSGFYTRRDSLSWLHRLEWKPGWTLVAGLDYADEQSESRDLLANTTGFDKRLQNHGVFVSQYASVDIYSASLSLRQDRHDTFGSYETGNLTLAAQILPALKLYGAYGSAFRAPSAADLYYPGFFGMYKGNPALQPEESRTGEVGVELRQGGQRLRLSAYRNQVTDLITAADTFPYDLENVARARLQGVELEAGGRVADWTWRLNAGSQSAEDGSGDDLPRRPQGTFGGLLEYAFSQRVNAGTEVTAQSSSKDAGEVLGGFTVFNLYAGWQVLPSLKLGARLENAGDKQYQKVLGYNATPRSGYVTASYSWQ